MIKSIKLKLWLTLFVTLLLTLGALLLVTYLSVKQRFLDYATHQILERLEPLEQAVIDVYNENHSLAPFVDSPTRWNQLRDTTYRQYLKHQNRRPSELLNPNNPDWSERESIEKKLQPDQRAFFQHLVLFDKDKQTIAGSQSEREDVKYILKPLTIESEVIAHIGYIKPKAFLRAVEKLFVDQQIQSFGVLSVIMVFTALLITILVSRWLITPISLLAKSAKKVASGDFSVRVNFRATDELGKLCKNFDDMVQSLEQNEVTRKQWVADISHEMRTPLSVLKAQIEAMEDGIRPATPDNLQLLNRNVDSLAVIINDLYELSLADLGALKLQKQDIDLDELTIEVADEFEEKFRQKEIKMFVQSADEPLFIMADSKRIKQVLINLLENSYRYTDAGGEIHIHLLTNETSAIVEVEDSAPGIDNEELSRIFDRLFRIEASRNRETGGAGLGLSICKGIAESHGGSISASQSPLGGIKQTLILPKTHD